MLYIQIKLDRNREQLNSVEGKIVSRRESNLKKGTFFFHIKTKGVADNVFCTHQLRSSCIIHVWWMARMKHITLHTYPIRSKWASLYHMSIQTGPKGKEGLLSDRYLEVENCKFCLMVGYIYMALIKFDYLSWGLLLLLWYIRRRLNVKTASSKMQLI